MRHKGTAAYHAGMAAHHAAKAVAAHRKRRKGGKTRRGSKAKGPAGVPAAMHATRM